MINEMILKVTEYLNYGSPDDDDKERHLADLQAIKAEIEGLIKFYDMVDAGGIVNDLYNLLGE